MQYFVSVEKTPYFYWQLEILIESFKKFNLLDNLLIAMADSDEGGNKMPKNISKCNVLLHKNWGKDLNYKYINKFLSLDLARKTFKIKPPFTVIEPDMIMRKPIDLKFNDVNVYTNTSLDNTLDKYKNSLLEYNVQENNWKNVGGCMVVGRDCPVMYMDMANYCKEVLEFFVKNKKIDKYWRFIDEISIILTLMKYNIKFDAIDNFENDLFKKDSDSYFIHYNNPYELFSKFDYMDGDKDTMNFNSYQKILTINPEYSKNIEFLQDTIKSYLEN